MRLTNNDILLLERVSSVLKNTSHLSLSNALELLLARAKTDRDNTRRVNRERMARKRAEAKRK